MDIFLERVSPTEFQVTSETGEFICRSSDPEHAACRVLNDLGLKGEIRTFHKGSEIPAMILDIERDSRYCVVDSDKQGLRRQLYRPFPV